MLMAEDFGYWKKIDATQYRKGSERRCCSDNPDDLLLGEEWDAVLGPNTHGRDGAAAATVDDGRRWGNLADSRDESV